MHQRLAEISLREREYRFDQPPPRPLAISLLIPTVVQVRVNLSSGIQLELQRPPGEPWNLPRHLTTLRPSPSPLR
jgi:hypothetical protein